MEALKEGKLKSFLDFVQNDHTLDLEIRDNYINIYYRGGNLVKIEQDKNGEYNTSFEENYFDENVKKNKEGKKITVNDFPEMKQAMDKYLITHSKLEREFQQLIVRENNYSSNAISTDYYIADIEYAVENSRSDMIAVKLESDKIIRRRKAENLDLAIIEVKYGDDALEKDSGIIGHLKKANDINIEILRKDMIECLKQKRELGLFGKNPSLKKDIESFKSEIDFIFILINHDPEKSKLKEEIYKIEPKDYPKFKIKFAVSNFMGYGLYENNIYSLEEFIKKFEEQI